MSSNFFPKIVPRIVFQIGPQIDPHIGLHTAPIMTDNSRHFWEIWIFSNTDYGCPMKPFFIKIPNFWAWADKWGR